MRSNEETYYRGVDEGVFKGCVAGEELAVEKRGISHVAD